MANRVRSMMVAVTTVMGCVAAPARAADYVVIPLQTTVNAPAAAAWQRIAGFCDIARFLKTSCVITSGKADEVGAVRRIAGSVDEVLVARTAWSYTYAQPKSPIDYHGTVEIRADGPARSSLLYTLVYDAAALPAGSDRAKDAAGRRVLFTRVISAMKAAAEAQ